ncbi:MULTISPECIES: NAD(P)-dependent oxidoreductase [unclassified Leifsonia]|uniref:NAD(P)-dependent oxidoreductase n=1 Tax=unclassified Leifsonia TaxID=2663824 RepID=UPI001FCE24A1|nr:MULTISPECIES: NAD(P)-dependent oxidoreductase [unclassified Leifsonia]
MVTSAPASTNSPDVPGPAAPVGISIFGCAPDEAELFRRLSGRLGMVPAITASPLSASTVDLVAGNRCVSVGHENPIDGATLRRLRDVGVAYLSTRSTGVDHIDAESAASVGIAVEGVAYSPDSVADHALLLMLAALRNARSTILRAESHDFRLNDQRGRELRDLTVGVVGTGRIGRAVIQRLRGFGCRILPLDGNADPAELDDLLERSDLVTLHAPLTASTRHLLDAGRLGRMRPGAILVNTARGGLVDTEALLAALEGGRLGGAALDVVEGEAGIFYSDRRRRPIEDEVFLRLQRLPNVLITPHTAYYTEHALLDIVRNTLLNTLEFEGHPHA